MPDIQLVDLAATDKWQTGLNALYDLHQQRWTAKGEKGAFAEEATRRMHIEIVDQFRQQGMVRLPAFVAGDEILAVNYVYCLDDTHYSYLSAYRMDTEWSKYSLGMQIRRASLVHAIESGVKIYDFLRGDEPYKQRFAAQPAENIDLHIFSSTARLNTFKAVNKLKEYKRLVPAPVKLFLKKRILKSLIISLSRLRFHVSQEKIIMELRHYIQMIIKRLVVDCFDNPRSRGCQSGALTYLQTNISGEDHFHCPAVNQHVAGWRCLLQPGCVG